MTRKDTNMDWINQLLRKVPTWLVYIVGLIPVPLFLYLAQTGGLGREPIKALEHELGELALKLIIVGLAITPLRKFVGLNLIKFRRSIGVLAFTYVALHLLVWLVLDVGILSQIWADILKRPYITIGMVGFVVMIPLAVTSNNWSVKRLGGKWRRLHQLTYVAAALGGLHFIMIAKGIQLEPLIYMAVILSLLVYRLPMFARKSARQ
ncbi:MAG: protein-methionine-sulfoxide reductase heme-binding subunit MsrQ [Ascidiaceihabitans sp.]|nr:protein-methionine-sulfoxide reductase heme-binding subunit MsrQ [Ascidiaceihabitans sp.]